MTDLTLSTILKTHRRGEFGSTNQELNQYLARTARQDHDRGLCTCFVLSDAEMRVAGYFTLSAESIYRGEVLGLADASLAKLQKSYEKLPVLLLGRLAIDNAYRGQDLGRLLLRRAMMKALDISLSAGVVGLVTDPIDGFATIWYERQGFEALHNSNRMISTHGMNALLS